MGLETAAIAMAAVAAGATVGKMGMEVAAENQKEKALDLQAKEMALQTQQKTLANYDVMEKVLDAQQAHMTVTGTAFSSPSYNAIARNTLNIGSKKQRNTDIEGDLADENIKIEKENVRNTLYAQLFGDTANLAMSAFSVAAKAPTAASTGV
jgi:hypothetical protein